MENQRKRVWFLPFIFLLVMVGCSRQEAIEPSPEAIPSPASTSPAVEASDRFPQSAEDINFITIATDAPSRFQDFEDIDPYGNVIGFDPDLVAEIAAEAGFEYEFVVTSFSGLLDSIRNGEFDSAMSAIVIPEQPVEGLAYTDPYLEVGQVLVVRANETELESYQDIGVGIPIGVQQFSEGEQTARSIVGLREPDLQLYDSTPAALQALIDRAVEGVILDSDDAEYFTGLYPLQLKIAGGAGQETWITRKAYGMAVSEQNEVLLETLNTAIAKVREDGAVERLTQAWLVPDETINAGESLVGTPDDELVIGMVANLTDLDPAAREPDLASWEVKRNIMSGLLMVGNNNQLVPLLAEDFPTISEDKTEYTFRLRPGLTFPDGSELTAGDVRFSVSRAAGLGNFQVNRYLKDDNGDNFADADAVQVVDPQTVKFVLKEPTSYFPSVLATPPFSIVSEECYSSNPDPVNACSGIGPYQVLEWQPGVQLRLQANPDWPGEAPRFEYIQLRFYDDSSRMRLSLENSAIDMAWTGLSAGDLRDLQANPEFVFWEGPATFKSYLVLEQSESPWSNARLREAISYAVDREALAEQVFLGSRKPLNSPVPEGTPGHLSTEPARDLELSRSILTASGYSPGSKLEMTIWFVDDNRYTELEADYAALLKEQLEETDLIQVTLESAGWQVFRPESLNCNYPAFLLGWPSIDQPPSYLDAMSWMEYFITNTDNVCSNYESSAMEELYQEAMAETDEDRRLELYEQIQELWAREFPTIDLTQEQRAAISLPGVQNVFIDAMGLLHYDELTKEPS
jgi:peptide/nickel transport system substrate-binding protein